MGKLISVDLSACLFGGCGKILAMGLQVCAIIPFYI
uniref:Uncharacterized protein n=1 Tax=Rhizophora mucronata TaxID=61149 RepID=A0A2P2JD95_RHIMU